MAEIARSREGVRGVHSTGEGVQDNALEGRDPALVTAAHGGKREGMVARPNHPIDNVRKLQRRLYLAAWGVATPGGAPASSPSATIAGY